MNHGWDSYIAYGRCANPSQSHLIRIGSTFNTYEHFAENRFLDNEGLASRCATYKFVREVEDIKPDLIHLHNIHDHYLNYPILFDYLAKSGVPVVWTQHDCWAFTGGCKYYELLGCAQWKQECLICPQNRAFLLDRTKMQYNLKKEKINQVKNLTLVPVSAWLENELRASFLKHYDIVPIFNGVDINLFNSIDGSLVREKYGFGSKKILLGVANIWEERKGLSDYIQLAKLLNDDYRIVLLGLSNSQIKCLPTNIIGIKRTEDILEMVQLYSTADIVLNLSYEETFGLTTVEGMACGTPGIVYDLTASPELISPSTGIVVKGGDIKAVKDAIYRISDNPKSYYSINCRKKVMDLYDKDKCFEKYITLYGNLLIK